ncbi:hypothetical protein LYNGBM3L_41620 [Moorena producens 3L]|uniref:Uncharacterized protein n=1 Tax=Moorena producens 3L TaxID=489825 RepID=F4XVQ4_9CYAN|nr:hypothetical protein LYNGBM3L_41620 [Moorena producens 3L]
MLTIIHPSILLWLLLAIAYWWDDLSSPTSPSHRETKSLSWREQVLN